MVIMEKPVGGSKTMAGEKSWSVMKKGSRRASRNLYCWICIFSVLFIILACPGLDPLDRSSGPPESMPHVGRENVDPCRGRRVYMYDLPPEFNRVVQNESKCRHFLMHWMDLCPRFENQGYGVELWNESESGDGFDRSHWFDTDSYMLEVIFHTRMQTYRCRTNESSEADAFFIPYYTGLHALEPLYEMPDLEPTYEKRKLFGSELVDWLEKNGEEGWKRYCGRDHFLVMGRTTWDFKLSRAWGTGFSELPLISSMTHLMLEKNPRQENELAVPYPTSFHPDSHERLGKWITRVEKAERKFLFSYVGAPRSETWSVRGKIAALCLDAGESVCNLVNCSVVRCSHDPVVIYSSFLQSNFCLQPRGDSSTRRSTFDCLISGAIPVFFHEDSAYTQYLWHLPVDPSSYSVYIPEEDIKNGVLSVQDVLMSYSAQRISEMRRTIISIIPNLLYFDLEKNPSSPMEDAFELSISGVLDRIAAAKMQISSNHSC